MPWYSGPVPDSHITSRLRFVPLTEELVDADLAAVMASREYLRRWSDSPWPEDDFTRADNEEDLRDHRLEHEDGVAFTYSVLAASVERRRRLHLHPAAGGRARDPRRGRQHRHRCRRRRRDRA